MKINIKNTAELQKALDLVQSKSRTRCIGPYLIAATAEKIDARLDTLRVLKKDRQGMVFMVNHHAQDFANAYHGVPMSTHIRLEVFPSGWFVTDIKRDICDQKEIRFFNESDYRRYYRF